MNNHLENSQTDITVINDRFSRLESIVSKIGQAVLATTETVERMAERVDTLAVQIQHQGHQVQQQGYQIFALSDALQTLVETQSKSDEQVNQLTNAIQHLIATLETQNQS
jgi:predicted  nucleic acid-binding Zn-ribbon protein